MNSPATIEGSAVIASTTVRTIRANLPPTSVMKTAVPMPSGSVIDQRDAELDHRADDRVQDAALARTPSLGPTPLMSSVKKLRCGQRLPAARRDEDDRAEQTAAHDDAARRR